MRDELIATTRDSGRTQIKGDSTWRPRKYGTSRIVDQGKYYHCDDVKFQATMTSSKVSLATLYDALAAYLEIRNYLGLIHEQKRDYLHHPFYDETKIFYRTYVEDNQGTFAEAYVAITSEFKILRRQTRYHILLMKIAQSHVMRTKKQTTTEALEFIRNMIYKLAEQAPELYREAIDGREYMYTAFIG